MLLFPVDQINMKSRYTCPGVRTSGLLNAGILIVQLGALHGGAVLEDECAILTNIGRTRFDHQNTLIG